MEELEGPPEWDVPVMHTQCRTRIDDIEADQTNSDDKSVTTFSHGLKTRSIDVKMRMSGVCP